MKKKEKLFIIVLLSGFFMLTACKDDIGENLVSSDDKEELEFELTFASRTATNSSLLESYEDYFDEDKSCVLISQRSSGLSLNFEEGNPNCYKYIYYKNDAADWDKDYNFKSENPLDWDKIRANGQYSNGYAFGALFFPRGNENINEVEADQSNSETFMESDILGAWHRTSIIRDRLRFRLNHLMCKLHINLYIPKLDEKTATGFNPEEIVANALSFRTDYAIEWGDRTTELPPIAKPSPSISGNVSDIKMYQRGKGEDAVLTKEELSNFNIDIEGMEEDKVIKYTFEAIFPVQAVKGDFLRFVMKANKTTSNYLFNSAYLTNNANGFAFQGGAITNLVLYLPRSANELLLIYANVKDWGEAESSFTILPDTKSKNLEKE